MDCRTAWLGVHPPVQPVIVPRYTVHERDFVFQVNFFSLSLHVGDVFSITLCAKEEEKGWEETLGGLGLPGVLLIQGAPKGEGVFQVNFFKMTTLRSS